MARDADSSLTWSGVEGLASLRARAEWFAMCAWDVVADYVDFGGAVGLAVLLATSWHYPIVQNGGTNPGPLRSVPADGARDFHRHHRGDGATEGDALPSRVVMSAG